MKPLTERQQQILDFIRAHVAAKGYPPTLREIGDEVGIRSTNGVSEQLEKLERAGRIEVRATKSRGIRLLDAAPTADDIRTLGAALGADLGIVGAPLPADWLGRCLRAVERLREGREAA